MLDSTKDEMVAAKPEDFAVLQGRAQAYAKLFEYMTIKPTDLPRGI